MTTNSLNGLRVLALESRRAREIAKLIENFGGLPMIAPSVREVPLDSNQEAVEFVRTLAAGQVEVVIFTTGVGVKALTTAVDSVCTKEGLARLLNQVVIVARGPKPTAALKDLGVRVSLIAPEPNTWRELLNAFDQNKDSFPLAGRRVVIQEYGVRNTDLSAALEDRGAVVTSVSIYQWALPEDLGPLRRAIESILSGEVHVLLIASSIQIRHLFQFAQTMSKAEALHDALSVVVIASVGPLTSEELRNRGLAVDIESTHPKMGFLVQEVAEKAADLLNRKRGNFGGKSG